MINSSEAIIIKGARVHNLKNVDTHIPHNKLIVFTGPSGSGKSSLAFDTIYAEGQRRYIESFSSYARQFLDQMKKPDIQSITGLSPTISIEQRTASYNPRSTVGTITEIYDYLRLLFARISKPYCHKCQKPIRSQSPQQMVDTILVQGEHSKVSILAPLVRARKGEYSKELLQLRQKGFLKVRIDGEFLDLQDEIQLDKNKKHDIDVYVDRFIMKGDREALQARIHDSVELALKLADGLLVIESIENSIPQIFMMSEKFSCPTCQVNYPAPEPRTFSFNSPLGACSRCQGLGTIQTENEISETNRHVEDPHLKCPSCQGKRLRPESLGFKLGSHNISDYCYLPVSDLRRTISDLSLEKREREIGSRVIREILDRLKFIEDVGIGYLSLNRSAQSLSGGETQRIRLATQIGSSLVGVIYILDEPSIGLHQRDNHKLLSTLQQLRDQGNTVIIVEHDRETIECADWILDLGPGAGSQGGEIVAHGPLNNILKSKKSLTGKYLRQELKIEIPEIRRPWMREKTIILENAAQNNLKNIHVEFPLGVLTCVTGVSGSGKSTLVIDTLYRALHQYLYKVDVGDLKVGKILGMENIDKVIDIDQSPIGKTPRSNPATYTGLFGLIRDLFAKLPESQLRGYKPGRYSFNVKGGRCETCEGDGMIKIQMHFLPETYVQCESCRGSRYHRDTLKIKYKGKNIAEILEMTTSEATDFFDSIPTIKSKLKLLKDVGLGYIHLGQSATTLSGGEAQRIKLTKELARRSTGRTLYILDEPSTGLHFDDINRLISILFSLVNQGNTVVVIEHNLDIIKVADHVIELGPEGGNEGGYLLGVGTPEEIASHESTPTGTYLRKYLVSAPP